MKLKKISAFLTAVLLASTGSQAFATTTVLAKADTSMLATAITIANNYVGTDDILSIDNTKLKTGDVLYFTGAVTKTVIIDSTTSTSINLGQLGQKAGTEKVARFTPGTTSTSAAITLKYLQEKSPTVTTTSAGITVSVQGNVDVADVVTATGVAVGDKIVVYTSTDLKSKVIATSKVSTGTSISVALKDHESVTTPAGIYLSVIKTGATVSDPVLIKAYTAPSTTTAIPNTNILASSNAVLVTGLIAPNTTTKVAADIITVYNADPTGITDAKSLKAITLATGKVGKGNTYVFLTFKPLTATKIYVTKKSSNEVATAPIVITLASIN